nr:MAG TPA: hypothetical protein [Caudoviricetes sp.]
MHNGFNAPTHSLTLLRADLTKNLTIGPLVRFAYFLGKLGRLIPHYQCGYLFLPEPAHMMFLSSSFGSAHFRSDAL